MISHKYRTIFLHVPKTGGTTIENCLRSLDPNIPDQIPRKRGFTKILNDYKDYYVFTFVRNPYDRLISAWRWGEQMFKKHKDDLPFFNKIKSVSFPEYVRMITDDEYRYDNILNWSEYDQYHTIPQHCFIPDLNDFNYFGDNIRPDFCTDFIGSQESFNFDIKRVLCDILEDSDLIEDVRIGHRFKSNKKECDAVYTEELKNLVYDFYKKDFDYFGYGKDSIIL